MKDKKINVEPGKTYIGVVEDNQDPDRLGRCKVRVVDIHDGRDKDGKYLIPTEGLQWAMPWKDTNGNYCNIPDKGKVVAIIFESGKETNPEILYSTHYNVNLEEKLALLTDEDYLSMKSLLFDHKTQIYVNDSEGLKIDHKFNNVNITKDTIDLNLKDNFGRINLGTARSDQRAILGDNFTSWLDDFLNLILTNQAFIGNFAAPIVPSPKMMKHIRLYKSIKEPKILSSNVFIVDNEYVDKLDRIAKPVIGDRWESTVEENTITTEGQVDYQSQAGASSTTFPGKPLSEVSTNSAEDMAAEIAKKASAFIAKQGVAKDVQYDVKVLTRLLKKKNYKIYTENNKLNIVAVRHQCLRPKDPYTDRFVDYLYVMSTDDVGEWFIKHYKFSTVPGVEFILTEEKLDGKIKNQQDLEYVRKNFVDTKITTKNYFNLMSKYGGIKQPGLSILAPSQYEESFQIVDGGSLRSRDGATHLVWTDKTLDKPDFMPDNMAKPAKTQRAFYLTKGYPGGIKVGHWGMNGDQCFSSSRDLEDFLALCSKHQQKYGNSFTYTLVTKSDWDQARTEQDANPTEPILDSEDKSPTVKPYLAKDEQAKKPQILDTEIKVLAFQVWAGKNGSKIQEDGVWGEQTNGAWQKLERKFKQAVSRIKDGDVWLGLARLAPYGSEIDLGQGVYGFKSKFNNNRYSILLQEQKKFSIFDEVANVMVSSGEFANGCLTLKVTTGKNQGKTFTDDTAWDNVRKIVSQ